MIALRVACLADLAALVELERAAFPDAWAADALLPALASGSDGAWLALVASLDWVVAGYALWQRVLDEAELLRVAVAPAARRHQLARELLVAGHAALAARGVVRCHLEVRADNTPALGLYDALGYLQVGRRRGYYRDGCDALLLRLELTRS